MTSDRQPDPTRLLQRLETGDEVAGEELLPLVYDELKRLAQRLLQDHKRGHTWQATELIHEAYLRLDGSAVEFASRRHYVRVAARAMRYALVDHARRRGAGKRGGDRLRVTLDEDLCEVADRAETVLAIDATLSQLAENDERLAKIVELKFFGGLAHEEIAAALDISLRSVERGWRLARAWLVGRLEDR